MRAVVVGSQGYWGQKLARVLLALDHEIVDEINLPLDGAKAIARYEGRADCAVIATPPKTHHQIAMAAMRAGLDVLIEKPMATNAKDAREIEEFAVKNGRVVSVDHTYVHTAACQRLREQQAYLRHYQSFRLNLGPALSTPAGWDLVVHDVAVLVSLGALRPGAFHGDGTHSFDGDVAHAELSLKWRGHADIVASRLWPRKTRLIAVVYENNERFMWTESGLAPFSNPYDCIVPEQHETLACVIAEFAARVEHRCMTGLTDATQGRVTCAVLEELFGPVQ